MATPPQKSDRKTKLDKYAELQPLVQKEIDTQFEKLYQKYAAKYGVAEVPLHTHNGTDSQQISQANVIPNLRASGSITMATDGARYELGTPFRATQILFYGNVVHRTAGTIDVRAQVIGSAQLCPSYYYQPQSSTSVKTGGPIQSVIQSGSYLLVDSRVSPERFRALATETRLISVLDPVGGVTVVARATVPDKWGTNGVIYVDVELEADWEINGNFVVT